MEKKNIGPVKYILIFGGIFLCIWLFVKYVEYKRYTPPVSYEYKISDQIDESYHDQTMVQVYFENVYRLSSFANEQWYNYEIDVRFPNNENPQSILANKTYQKLISNTQHLEAVLKKSKQLKKEGLSNNEIKTVENTGESIEKIRLSKLYARVNIADGDKGADVVALQKELNSHGFDLPETGVFSSLTEEAVMTFQTNNKLFPTGIVDQQTLQILLNKTN